MHNAPLIDMSFALSQLSGNHSLVLKMFQRFEQEYQDAPNQLQQLLEEADLCGVKTHIHTLKGVAGNLGFSALHGACVAFENTLKLHADPVAATHNLLAILGETLAEIKRLQTTSQTQPTFGSDGGQALLEALNNSVFIPADQLEQWLEDTSLTEAEKAGVRGAVNDLDYPQALQLLQS